MAFFFTRPIAYIDAIIAVNLVYHLIILLSRHLEMKILKKIANLQKEN